VVTPATAYGSSVSLLGWREQAASGFEVIGHAEFGQVMGVEFGNWKAVRVGLRLMLQGIGRMDGGQRRERPAPARLWAMVHGDGFDNIEGQSPQTEKVGANFGVSGPEKFAFGFWQGNPLLARKRLRLFVEIWRVRCQHEPANVVEEPCGHGFLLDA
jgi:hypothetical protein